MENTLIQDNFDKLMTLNKQDREMVIEYFNNWTEQLPAHFNDGHTLGDRHMKMFNTWLDNIHPNLSEEQKDYILESAECEIMDWQNDAEYSVKDIVSTGNNEPAEDWYQSMYEIYFQECLEMSNQ